MPLTISIFSTLMFCTLGMNSLSMSFSINSFIFRACAVCVVCCCACASYASWIPIADSPWRRSTVSLPSIYAEACKETVPRMLQAQMWHPLLVFALLTAEIFFLFSLQIRSVSLLRAIEVGQRNATVQSQLLKKMKTGIRCHLRCSLCNTYSGPYKLQSRYSQKNALEFHK